MKSILESSIYNEGLKSVAKHLPEHDSSYLVTGATGLIGSCMVDVLLWANRKLGHTHQVYTISRTLKKLKSRFEYAQDSGWLHFIEQDISCPLSCNIPVDYIIHAASNADPQNYSLYPAETILTNVCGTENILNYCRQNNVKRLLFTSTFEVYGKITGTDIFEETMSGILDPTILRNCYPESKRCAEFLVRCYSSEYKVNAVIARLCSIYGPTMQSDDSKAHAQFIRNALANEDIILKSPGMQLRTYCYVLDAVDALFKILFEGQTGEIYNIANEKSIITISELAHTIAALSGARVVFRIPDSIEQGGYSQQQNCVLSNRKLKALGWNGRYDIEDGIAQTLSILREVEN